jgi:pimeloyl-ACP methyl ester carboxylesterase
MIIYFVSGLGADERVFERLQLPQGYEMRHIPWESVAESQTIESYARRLARKIDGSKPFMLAGLSFGGMIATEICKFLEPEKLLLFSTVKTAAELPALYRLAGKLKLYRILPAKIFKITLPFLYWFLGATDEHGRKLISSYVERMDPLFLKWAIREITCWENKEVFEPQLHIHGGGDRVFPISLVKAGHVMSEGTHLSVLYDADRINRILAQELIITKQERSISS